MVSDRARPRSSSLLLAVALVAATLALTAPPAAGAPLTVDSLDDTVADDASCTLREAIGNANADDQSVATDCPAGSGEDVITFSVTGTIFLGASLVIADDIVIQGPGAASLTISGDTNDDDLTTPDVHTLLRVAAETHLSGVTLTEGDATDAPTAVGGGIHNTGATLVVSRSVLVGNRAGFGGAIYTIGGSTEIRRSELTGNSAVGRGGALVSAAGSDVTVRGSTISGNSTGSGDGGAVYVEGMFTAIDTSIVGNTSGFDGGAIGSVGSVELIDSTVAGNTAHAFGGGVWTIGGLTVTSSTFAMNASETGGAIATEGGSVTVTNATLTRNVVSGLGGGIFVHDGLDGVDVSITSSTIAGNTSGDGGGGFFLEGDATLRSTIVAHNVGNDCRHSAGIVVDEGYNIVSDGSCFFLGPTSLPSTDPQLEPLDDNGGPTETMSLAPTSPAVDLIPDGEAGCGTEVSTDQRGFERPFDGGCDVGAFEYSLRGRALRGTLTVELTGDGQGSVTSEPIGISCPSDCVQSVPERAAFVLTAQPDEGSRFLGWDGTCDSKRAKCRIRVRGDVHVTARFG